jgi:hypothetical protein
LYGYKTWYLTSREKHSFQVSEIKVLGQIFGPKEIALSAEIAMLLNEELCDLCRLPVIVRIITRRRFIWIRHIAMLRRWRGGGTRNAYRIHMGKPFIKHPLGRPRR